MSVPSDADRDLWAQDVGYSGPVYEVDGIPVSGAEVLRFCESAEGVELDAFGLVPHGTHPARFYGHLIWDLLAHHTAAEPVDEENFPVLAIPREPYPFALADDVKPTPGSGAPGLSGQTVATYGDCIRWVITHGLAG